MHLPFDLPDALRPRRRGPDWTTLAVGAAAGFAAGLLADPARRFTIQHGEMLAGDWVKILEAEHKLVDKMFGVLERTTENQVLRRRALFKHVSWSLYKHGLQEEAAVYPAMRQARPQDFDHLSHDHAEIKAFIYDLDRMDASDSRWLTVLRGFHELIQRHVREEEDEIFPAFRSSQSTEEVAKLTHRMMYEGFKIA